MPLLINMGDGRQRPRIVVIMASTVISQRLNKSRDEAEAAAQAAFNKLRTDDHYPTEGEILAECGVVIDPREDKPWPEEEDCRGCDKHKDGPHRFGCSLHGARQPKFYASTTKDGRIQIDVPKPSQEKS